jgi:uncharacterized protein (UPF0210 family)
MTQEALLPTVGQATEACDFMASQVHAPAFFEKLASHNIRPRNDAEVQQLLQLGAMLHQAELQGQYKMAADARNEQENPFLAHAIGQAQQVIAPLQATEQVKQAALSAVQADPTTKAAALIYGHVANGGDVADDPEETPEQ